MNILIQGIISYFVIGLVVLISLDVATKKIRKWLKVAPFDTQAKLATSGNYTGIKSATVIILLALWLFWPLAIFSVLVGIKK